MPKKRREPFSTSDLVLFLRECRRRSHTKPAWSNREQMILLSSVFSLRGSEMIHLRVDDVHLTRGVGSHFYLCGVRHEVRDRYALSRMRIHMSMCRRGGREYWLEGEYTGLPMNRDNLWRSFREGVNAVYGSARRLGLGSTRGVRGNVRCSSELAMREMLSLSMEVPCDGTFGEYLSGDLERSAFTSSSMQGRALELSLTPERVYDIPRLRKHLRKLGLSESVESCYSEFLGYLELANPGGSTRWRVCKFYEWVCEEVLDASRGESFDVSGGSWSGVDGVAASA